MNMTDVVITSTRLGPNTADEMVSLSKADYFALLSRQKTEADEDVIKAAFEWRKDMYEGSYLLLKAVEAHPDFKP